MSHILRHRMSSSFGLATEQMLVFATTELHTSKHLILSKHYNRHTLYTFFLLPLVCCGEWSHISIRVASTFTFTQYTSVSTSFDYSDKILLVWFVPLPSTSWKLLVNFSRTTPATDIMDNNIHISAEYRGRP